MTRVDNSIEIKAPKEKVFAYVSDVGNQGEWVKWAKNVQVTSPERATVGATDSMLMQVGPTRSKVEGIITEISPGFTLARRLTRGMDMTERMSVLPTADGAKIAWNVEYTPPMGPMGQMMDMMFMATLLNQLMEDSLAILKTKMEAK